MAADLLLIDPPHRIFGALRLWMPSPGLMALAAWLERAGKTVDLVDATVLDRPWDDLARILGQGRYPVVGVTCPAATFHQDLVHALRLVRRTLPGALVLAGGGHASLNARLLLEQVPELDAVIVGEGEQTLLEVLERWPDGGVEALTGIDGLALCQDGIVHFTPPRPLMTNLDALPFPAYHKIDFDNPVYDLHGMGRRAVGLSTSRGCGDRCSYCSEAVLWQSHWRGRSGALVVEEMQRLNRDLNKSLFVFNENSFNQSRRRNEAFLEALGGAGLACDFWFQSRVKDILRDRDLLDDFKRLGLYEVMLGVESIAPGAQKNYHKKQSREEIREAAALLRERGIMVMTNVMFGDVDDTEDALDEIYRFAADIGDFLVLCITTPLPGTAYHAQAMAQGRIEENDFARYDFMHPVMPNNACSREEILALQKRVLRRYYTRPVIFRKMLFSKNPFIRMAYRLIMRYAWYEARNKEWVQDKLPAGSGGIEGLIPLHGIEKMNSMQTVICKCLQGAADARRRACRRTMCTSNARERRRCGTL
jgi:anaerobic magnesium-protoporphyrin IX monomethyl ester cyclase